MASHLAATATRSQHQSLHHFVADSAWSDEQMLLRVAQWVVPALAQIESLLAQGAPKHCLLADAGYGGDTAFREP